VAAMAGARVGVWVAADALRAAARRLAVPGG
jgi:hypothetical protein